MKNNIRTMLRQARSYPVDAHFLASLRVDLVRYMKIYPPEFRSAKTDVSAKPAGRPFFGFAFLVPIPLAVLLIIGGAVFGSRKSLPGEFLYPVKLAAENARLTVTVNPLKKTELEISFVRERLAEIQTVIEKSSPESAPSEEKTFGAAFNNISSNLNRALRSVSSLRVGGNAAGALKAGESLSASASEFKKILEEQNKSGKLKSTASISAIDEIQVKVSKEIDGMRLAENDGKIAENSSSNRDLKIKSEKENSAGHNTVPGSAAKTDSKKHSDKRKGSDKEKDDSHKDEKVANLAVLPNIISIASSAPASSTEEKDSIGNVSPLSLSIIAFPSTTPSSAATSSQALFLENASSGTVPSPASGTPSSTLRIVNSTSTNQTNTATTTVQNGQKKDEDKEDGEDD